MTKKTAEEMSLILLKSGTHGKIDVAILKALCEGNKGGVDFNSIFGAVRSKLFVWMLRESPSDIKLYEEIVKSLFDMEAAGVIRSYLEEEDDGTYGIVDEYIDLVNDLFAELDKK